MKPFRILRKNMVLKNPWMSVEQQRVLLPNGEEADWFVGKSADVVVVVPLFFDGRIALQESYKHGSGEVIVEFCAGMIDKGESPLMAAKRELREESGIVAEKWKNLGTFFTNPTGSAGRVTFFLAENAETKYTPQLEKTEQIKNITRENWTEVRSLFSQRKTSASAMTALFLAQEKATDQ